MLSYEQFGSFSEEGERLLAMAISGTDRLARVANVIEQQPETVSPKLLLKALETLKLGNELAQSLDRGEVVLDYQPIISMAESSIIGFEALAKWQHPERGIILPKVLVPIAEQVGLIHRLNLDMLERACQQLASWQAKFPSRLPLTVSINFSPMQLKEPDLSQRIYQLVQSSGILPATLKLEITGNSLMAASNQDLENLGCLSEIGVEVYLDDFGTGCSSLARLQGTCINALKIGGLFVRNHNWIMTEAIMLVAKRLQMPVTAKGVETATQLEALKQLECQNIQGRYVAEPMCDRRISQLLADKNAALTPAK